MSKRNCVPYMWGKWAQVKVLTTTDDILWSKEKYMVVRAPTVAGGRYALRKRGDYGPYTYETENELRLPELTGPWTLE